MTEKIPNRTRRCLNCESHSRLIAFLWRNGQPILTSVCDFHAQELVRYMKLTVTDTVHYNHRVVVLATATDEKTGKDVEFKPAYCGECFSSFEAEKHYYNLELAGSRFNVPFYGCEKHLKDLFAYFDELESQQLA